MNKRKKQGSVRCKKIKISDEVVVLSGKDRGRKGKIAKIWRDEGKVLIEGINKVKKHVKPQGKNKPGGIIEVEKPIAASKVMIICPSCQKPTRVGFKSTGKGEKYRVCKKCGGLIDRGGNK
jgi:large subunit ribosomal protein L24